MKKFFAIFVIALMACTMVFATACVTEADVTTGQLLEAMSDPGAYQNISIVVSTGEVDADDYVVIYSYGITAGSEAVIGGVLAEDPDADVPEFDLADRAQAGFTFERTDFDEESYDNRYEEQRSCYVVTGDLADAARFLGVDAASATVTALIGTDLKLDALTINYTSAESGNDILIDIIYV